MKCVKCGKKAEIKVQNQMACKDCFLQIIQKRVRKELRIKEPIERNDKILIIDDGSAGAKLSEYLFRDIIKDLPVEIVVKKMKYELGKKVAGKYDKLIIPWSTDYEDEYFLECLFTGKKPNYLGHYTLEDKRYIKLLIQVTDQETKDFADIKKMYYQIKKKDSQVTRFLTKLEEEYPSIKFSLLNSIRYLDENFYK